MRCLLITVLSLLLMIGNSSAADKGAFTGSWGFKAGDDNAFSLELTQNGNRIQG